MDWKNIWSKVEKRSLRWDFTIACRQRTATATLTCISTLSYPSYTPSAWYTPPSLSVPTHSFFVLRLDMLMVLCSWWLKDIFFFLIQRHMNGETVSKIQTTNLISRLLQDVICWKNVQISMKHRKVHYDKKKIIML